MKNHRRNRALKMTQLEPLENRRLFAAGVLDKSFSADGKTTIAEVMTASGLGNIDARDVAVQSDGKTVVAGTFVQSGSSNTDGSFTVARFNLDGSLDQTFGSAGKGIFSISVGKKGTDRVTSVAIQSDGKILVAGSTKVDRTAALDTTDFAVIRLLTTGRLDNSFDGDGMRTIKIRESAQAEDIAVQSDGKIILAGSATEFPLFRATNTDMAVVRLKSNGSLDSSFNGGGIRTIGTEEKIDSGDTAAIDSNGNIVIGGATFTNNLLAVSMARVKPNGTMDTSFGNNGRAINPIASQNFLQASGMVIQGDGKIVVSGTNSKAGVRNAVMVRYLTNGSRDLSFGGVSGGVVLPPGLAIASDVIRSADGGLIVGGGTDGKFTLIGFNANGVLNSSFGTGGKVVTDFGDAKADIMGLAKGPGKRFVATGRSFGHTARYLDSGANVVLAAALDTRTTEGTTDTASMLVTRSERLPTPTRIFFTIGGTAKFSSTFGSDYQLSGLSIGKDGRPFVDIPANETFAIVRIAAIDDAAIEGNETAVFTIASDANYDLGSRAGATINIIDNDAGVTTNLSGVNDAYVRDGANANTNFGSANELQIKTGGAGFNRLSYIKFDLSSVSSIVDAKLQLFGNMSDTQNISIPISLFPVAENTWTGSGITFNNKPSAGTTQVASTTVVGTTQTLYEFDVTNYVRQEKVAGRNLVSFLLKSLVNSASFASFVSGNAASKQPKLSIISAASSAAASASTVPPVNVQSGRSLNFDTGTTIQPLRLAEQLFSDQSLLSAEVGIAVE